MDDRARWQTLQAHLAGARRAVKADELDGALEHVDAALAIDSEFLAARALRDRIVATTAPTDERPAIPAIPVMPGIRETPGIPGIPGIHVQTPAAPALVSLEAFARFEARARQRRVERRLEAARAAVALRDFAVARAAISEVRELEPEHGELDPLAAELRAAERNVPAQRHVRDTWNPPNRWIAVAGAIAGLVLGASTLGNDAPVGRAPRVSQPVQRFSESIEVRGTTGTRDAESATLAPPNPRRPPPAAAEGFLLPAARPVVVSIEAPSTPLTTLPIVPMPRPDEPPPAPKADLSPPPASRDVVPPNAAASDEVLVKEVLERYRAAYDGLDARAAHAVWPGVNEPALERAFAGLESQRLTFDECNLRLAGVVATATCTGSTAYTPRVGSRDPHVEPRTWNFILRRTADTWQIDFARADR